MRYSLKFIFLIGMAISATGCFLLPAQKYDGSESFNEAHPEYDNTPAYMQPGDQHADGN